MIPLFESINYLVSRRVLEGNWRFRMISGGVSRGFMGFRGYRAGATKRYQGHSRGFRGFKGEVAGGFNDTLVSFRGF